MQLLVYFHMTVVNPLPEAAGQRSRINIQRKEGETGNKTSYVSACVLVHASYNVLRKHIYIYGRAHSITKYTCNFTGDFISHNIISDASTAAGS